MAIYNFISQHKILKLVLSVFLCLCLIFTFAIVKPLVDVNASATALAILSAATLTISLFSWFGWAVDVGEELTTTEEYKELWSSVGYNADCLWHFICGDFTEWHYEKYGYLHDFSVWYGYYVDDNGNIMHPSYTAENPTDISVNIDWDKFEKEGTISFNADTSVYNDTWFEIQEFMHGGGVKCLSEFVQEVSVEPTISELRDSAYNLYLGNLAYWTEDYHDGIYASGGIPESDASYYTFNNDNFTARFEKRLLVYSYGSQDYFFYIDFSNYDLCPWCLGDNGTTNEFFCNWAVSSPYLVNFDGNTYYKFYLFNFDETNPVIVPSVRICGTNSYIEYNCNQPFTYSGSIIERFDDLLNRSSSSSVDDTVRNSATANQYAGTVDDDDGNPIPVTAPGKAGTTTVTGASSVTNPVTGVKGEDYANGTSVPMTGTVEGATDITVSDTGEVAVDTTVSSSPQSPLSIEFITDFFGDFFDGITGLYSWLPDDFENLINGTLSTFFILSVAFVVLRLVGAIFEVIPFM